MKDRLLFILRFFRTPQYLPEFFLIVFNRIRTVTIGKKKQKVIDAWCADHAVSTQEALKMIIGKDFTYTPIIQKYSDDFKLGEDAVAACPVKMGGRGAIDLLHYLTEHTQATRVVETGVAYGWSSLCILLSLQHRQGHLDSVDMPYPLLDNREYVGCAVPEHLHTYWNLEQTCDRIALGKKEKEGAVYDLCHYDSDKTYYGRMKNYKRLWKMIKPGGIFISDDISDNDAFYDFCRYLDVTPIIVGFEGKYIGVLPKV